jgi:hypothetical protein
MNMRWGWTLAGFAALATALAAKPAWSQGGTYPAAAGGPSPAPGMVDPAMLAAMQAQAYQAMAAQQAAMYGQAAMYPQPGMQPVAYMPVPQSVMVQPQAPAPFPGGPSPDVNGAYGYMPSSNGGSAYGQPGYGPAPNGAPAYGAPGVPAYGAYGPDPYAGGAPAYDQGGYTGPGGMGGAGPYGGQNCAPNGDAWGIPGSDVNGQWLPNGLLGDIFGLIAPYPDGGCAAPRWYDFAADYMMLKRDNTGHSQNFTSSGISFGAPNIVLSTNNLDFGSYKPGFRFSAAVQLMAANSLEFTYFGQFNYTSHAQVEDPNGNLFSVFSNFGTQPFGGFAEFDQANVQRISYQSSFDSFEVNWRNRWMAPNCRYQGSWTLGIRHFILDEKFRYSSSSIANGFDPGTGFIPAQSVDLTTTTNDLTGFQIGTDMWICILPGLRVGGELQAGVYGNHMGINTTIGSNLNNVVFREHLTSNDVSFIGQANLLATYRFNYQWTGRIGYQFLYVDGVALGSENFNSKPPALFNPFIPRAPLVNDDGSVFYHGFSFGLEYMW